MSEKIINSKNLFYNVKLLKKLSNSPKFCAVIKANAYGHGAKKIARLLSGKVDYFAVANKEEAREISALKLPEKILVLSPSDKPEIIRNVEWTVSSLDDINELEKLGKKVFVHLKVNTGMNRFGMDENELKQAVDIIKKSKNIKIKGIFTHFFCGDNKKERNAQIKKFNQILGKLKLSKSVIVHASNTSGAIYGAGLDMCRCGIGIYGYGHKKLRPVLEIKSQISQIRHLKKGERLGYDGAYIAPKNVKIATVKIGYADGFQRSFSLSKVLVKGKKCSVVGNVCMDCFFCDVSSLKNVSVGEKVSVLGEKVRADVYAKKSKKITYEILCDFNKMR